MKDCGELPMVPDEFSFKEMAAYLGSPGLHKHHLFEDMSTWESFCVSVGIPLSPCQNTSAAFPLWGPWPWWCTLKPSAGLPVALGCGAGHTAVRGWQQRDAWWLPPRGVVLPGMSLAHDPLQPLRNYFSTKVSIRTFESVHTNYIRYLFLTGFWCTKAFR